MKYNNMTPLQSEEPEEILKTCTIHWFGGIYTSVIEEDDPSTYREVKVSGKDENCKGCGG